MTETTGGPGVEVYLRAALHRQH
jgi:hypothetical protein